MKRGCPQGPEIRGVRGPGRLALLRLLRPSPYQRLVSEIMVQLMVIISESNRGDPGRKLLCCLKNMWCCQSLVAKAR